MPDFRPPHGVIARQLVDKCHVLYFPVQFVNNIRSTLDQQFSGYTTAGSGSRDVSQSFEDCSRITDSLLFTECDAVIEGDVADNSADIANSSVHIVSTQCDAVSSDACVADITTDTANNSSADSTADTSADVVSLSASINADSDALHIVWPHRWYVSLLSLSLSVLDRLLFATTVAYASTVA